MAELHWDDAAVEALMAPGGPISNELVKRSVRVERAAKRLAPVDTGRLRASITKGAVERRSRSTLVVKIGTNVDYAAYVEFGTSRMRAQPYLRPALDAAR